MMLPAALAAPAISGAVVLAQPSEREDPGGQGEDFGKSSPVGLLLLLLFLIALVFLIRSMGKHLKRIPKSFDQQDEQDEQGGQQGNDEDNDQDDIRPDAVSEEQQPVGKTDRSRAQSSE